MAADLAPNGQNEKERDRMLKSFEQEQTFMCLIHFAEKFFWYDLKVESVSCVATIWLAI